MNWRPIQVVVVTAVAGLLVVVPVGCGGQTSEGQLTAPEQEKLQVLTADGSVVPPKYVGAYVQGDALFSEVNSEVASDTDPPYSDLYESLEEAVLERQPFPEGSIRATYFEAGAWEASGFLDGKSWKSSRIVLPTDWAHDGRQFAVRPKEISSGSSHWYSDLRWSGWGSKRAVGKGLEHTSGCGSCPEDPGSPTPVMLVVSELTKCKGRAFYLAVRTERPNAEPQSTRLFAEACQAEPENPFYDATVRENGMTEAELEAFFQRAVENGRMYARDYGGYAGALAACSRLVSGMTSGEIVPPQVAAMTTLEQQVVALAALAQVAAQGCNYGVSAELSGG